MIPLRTEKIKRRFKAKLARQGLSARTFAESLGISPQHLSTVLNRPSKSARVHTAILVFLKPPKPGVVP